MVSAFDHMDYTLKAISYEEAYYLKKYHISLKGWLGSADRVIIKKVPLKHTSVEFVILPWDCSHLADKEVQKLFSSLRKGPSLVVGLSPYGYAEEQDLLEKYPDVFDLLLGSGRGLIFSARVAGRTLWIRPMSQGKALYLIHIKDVEGLRSQGAILGDSISVERRFITHNIAPDPQIVSILEGK